MKTILLSLALFSLCAFSQSTKTPGYIIGAGAPSANCVVGQQYFNTSATAGQNLYGCTATNTWTIQSTPAQHTFGASFVSSDGSTALTAGTTAYFVMPYACTISGWSVTANAGTATVDIWKVASGTAIPTISNTITASAIPALATGTNLTSTTLTGWTTSVAANDIIGINLKIVATATYVNLTVKCS